MGSVYIDGPEERAYGMGLGRATIPGRHTPWASEEPVRRTQYALSMSVTGRYALLIESTSVKAAASAVIMNEAISCGVAPSASAWESDRLVGLWLAYLRRTIANANGVRGLRSPPVVRIIK